MPSIILSPLAVDTLLNDPKIKQWLKDKTVQKVPFLGYYRLSYSTARDGTITEYGDGFALTTIDRDDDVETRDIVIKSVPVGNVFHLLVGGAEETMARSFTIG